MKHLVIAEKPSVARDIARVLHCGQKSAGCMEGKDYIVTWALGHLVTLADPEQYGEQYKTWSMDTLPMLPKNWKLVVIRQTAKQYHAVRDLLFRKDVSDVIIATDAGREGELVARWILEKAGSHKPVRRLWISSVTDKAIREGFAHLRPGKDYENLYHAAVARAQADWVVGINATRALTCKYNAQLSCGRVQTPTLAMIAAREEEIRSFVPTPYYGLKAAAGGISFIWTDSASKSSRTFDKARIDAIYRNARKELKVTDIAKKTKKSQAPALYDLTALQKEANQRYGYSAKETLNIMQRLYETHKILTYPRTDSRYLTTDIVGTLKERLEACAAGPWRKTAALLARQEIRPSGSFVNNAKVSDHHAIIPTEEYVRLETLSSDERKIYDMVVRRFLAVLSPACETEEISVAGTIGQERFTAKGSIIRKAGWRQVYDSDWQDMDEDEDDFSGQEGRDSFGLSGSTQTLDQDVSSLRPGSILPVTALAITKGSTKPPAYFTEGTLVAAMENPVKYLKNKNKTIVRTLGETGGLGTVATRADIIEKLFNSFLMEKKGNEIHITSKGKQLLSLVPPDLKSPELTAQWELRLQAISRGKDSDRKFMGEIQDYTRRLIQQIKDADGTFHHDNLTRHKCPQCGKLMLEVNGKHGRLLVCQDRECGYRETLSRRTNARCPVCHKKMELVGKGDAQRFVCSCGHKEKLSAFQERKKKEGKGGNKRDVAAYMRKQAKEAEKPINNAFAEAFKNLDLPKEIPGSGNGKQGRK